MAADGDFDESFAGVQEADDAGSDFSLSSEDGGAFEDDDDVRKYRIFHGSTRFYPARTFTMLSIKLGFSVLCRWMRAGF